MLGEEVSCQQDLAIKGVARVPVLLKNASMIEIPLWRLGLSLIPILLVGWISFRWGGGAGSLSVATGRMVLQLFAIGYVLSFLFGIQSPWLTLGVVIFMILISAWIAIRTVKERRWSSYRDALLAIGIGGGLIYLLVIFGVIAVDPWYEPKYAISLSGMVFANAMTAVTLSAERFDAERMSGKSAVHARNTAWNAALIPQINTFLAVGLGFYLQINLQEWLWISLAISLVLVIEAINTAIELTLNRISREYHPVTKQAKDIAAGAVVLCCLQAIVIGLIVFIPKLWAVLFA